MRCVGGHCKNGVRLVHEGKIALSERYPRRGSVCRTVTWETEGRIEESIEVKRIYGAFLKSGEILEKSNRDSLSEWRPLA